MVNEVSLDALDSPFMAAVNALRAQLDELIRQQERDTKNEVTSFAVRAILMARSVRDEFFGDDLFGEPAWDILLGVFATELEEGQISIHALAAEVKLPPTTVLRWLSKLEERGLVQREPDLDHARRQYIRLTDRSRSVIQEYFAGPGRFLIGGS